MQGRQEAVLVWKGAWKRTYQCSRRKGLSQCAKVKRAWQKAGSAEQGASVIDWDEYRNTPQARRNGTGKCNAHLNLQLARDAKTSKGFTTTAAAQEYESLCVLPNLTGSKDSVHPGSSITFALNVIDLSKKGSWVYKCSDKILSQTCTWMCNYFC